MKNHILYIMKKCSIIIMSVFLLNQCTSSGQLSLKRSTNNKLFDMSRDRRTPLYNKKYIELAKKNVLRDEYGYVSEKENVNKFDEGQNLPEYNKDIYRRLIENDIKEKKITLEDGNRLSLSEANQKINSKDYDNILRLKEELKMTKNSLQKAQNELQNYKINKQCEICKNGTELISSVDEKKTNNKYEDNISSKSLNTKEYVLNDENAKENFKHKSENTKNELGKITKNIVNQDDENKEEDKNLSNPHSTIITPVSYN